MKRDTGQCRARSRRRVRTDALRRSTRRQLLAALGATTLGLSFAVTAQPAKPIRIGFLGPSNAPETADRVQALQAGLRKLGYHEGKNIVTEFRWADGDYSRLPKLAADLVRLKVDVVVTHGTPAGQAAKRETSTTPLVLATMGDPVELGFAASLARPGGNITGSTVLGREVTVKRIELLKELLPSANRFAVLVNSKNPSNASDHKALQAAAASLKIELQVFDVASMADLDRAFLEMAKKRIDAIAISQEGLFIANAGAIGAMALSRRIPSIGFTEIIEAGGLIGYGPSIPQMFHRAAYFVDRILKGSKPGDLPIEQPTKYELVINLRTAKALGVKIPQSLMVRADKVIG